MDHPEPRERWWRDVPVNALRSLADAQSLVDLDDAHEALNIEVRDTQAEIERAPHVEAKARLRQLCTRRAIVGTARRRALERSATQIARDCREKIRSLLDESCTLGTCDRAILRGILGALTRAEVTKESHE